MANHNVKIALKAKKDIDGRTYYVGKTKVPMTIDCEKGVTFLIFISDKDEEEMQIALMDNKKED